MEHYFDERCIAFNAESEWSCPDSCERYGCRETDLHIATSLVDLVAISDVSGQQVSEIFKNHCKIGFDPLGEAEAWVGRVTIELVKPCHFLEGGKCGVYPGRPIACALFPEAYLILEQRSSLLQRELFRKFPCLQNPCIVSPRRREVLQRLLEMSHQEAFLSDFYLFGMSPFVLDLKTIAGHGLEGVDLSGDGKARVPHERIEGMVLERLVKSSLLEGWEAKIAELDRIEAKEGLMSMKKWTDEIAGSRSRSGSAIAYQFDGDQLQPVRLCK